MLHHLFVQAISPKILPVPVPAYLPKFAKAPLQIAIQLAFVGVMGTGINFGVSHTALAQNPSAQNTTSQTNIAQNASTQNASAQNANAPDGITDIITPPKTTFDSNYRYQPNASPNTANPPFSLSQPLPMLDNFDKPVARLSGNNPVLGYDKTLATATLRQASTANTANSPSVAQVDKPIEQNLSVQKRNEQQVKQQLFEQDKQSNATDTSHISDTNGAVMPATSNGNSNAAHETDTLDAKQSINPNDYLPDYKSKEAVATQTAKTQKTAANKPENPIKSVYNKLFNRGASLPRAKVTIVNADAKKQPSANIKAALEQVTVESIEDFPATLPRIRQIAKDAAEAVGYYDTELSFAQPASDRIQVTVNNVGEPVKVTARVVDVRGEGGKGDKALPVYEVIQKELLPKVGDTFNHGVYKQSKATIESVAKNNGFFDGAWLNSSADITLPDKTAEVDLIYDTKGRYNFDDIKFYSIDKKGQLSDDPNKLPIKPKLLKQLMTYQKGDPYFQPYVTQFSNNLLATRYFNGVDMDVVMPPDKQKATGTLHFDSNGNAIDDPSPDPKKTTAKGSTATNDTVNTGEVTSSNAEGEIVQDGMSKAGSSKDPSSQTGTAQTNNTQTDKAKSTRNATATNTATANTQNPNDLAPLVFSVDDDTKERLTAVKQKAQQLLNSPEDVQLASDDGRKGSGPLAKIAYAVSKVAKKLDSHDDTPILLANANQKDVIAKKTPEEVEADKAVPTYIVLNATKPHEAQVGLGYETNKGIRVVGKLNNNLVNRDGLQGGVSVAVSKADQQVELTGSLPYNDPLDDKLLASVGYEHKSVDDTNDNFASNTWHAGIARNIKKESGWNRVYSLQYRYDVLDNKASNDDISKLPPPFNNTSSNYHQQALLLGYAINKTVTDNVLNPTKGYSQRYSIEAGANGVLTDTNLVILRAGYKGLYSFGEDNKHQLLGRADLGYIYSTNFYNVPYKLRFFAGGDQSIRGYSTDSQSPMSAGFLVGGNALATGSLEYNYEFRTGFRGALFTDVGNAYDFENKYSNKTKVGVGTGIRWASPIGLVRLDVAAGVSDPGTPVKIYLFIGSPL